MSRDDEVRRIAYDLWEQEGRPDGRDVEHWQRAEAIWQLSQSQPEPLELETSRLLELETPKPRRRTAARNRGEGREPAKRPAKPRQSRGSKPGG